MKNRSEFVNAVKAIAHDLGWAFDVTWDAENPTSARLVGPDDARIHVRVSTHDYLPNDGSRLEISGSFPHHPRYGSFTPTGRDYPHITVAASKVPHVIARDIRKRFLPHYLPLYQEATEFKQRYEDGLGRRKAAIQQLAEIMGSTAGRDRVSLPSHLNCYGGIEVHENGDAVNIKLSSVPVSLAIEIATVLAKFGGEDE